MISRLSLVIVASPLLLAACASVPPQGLQSPLAGFSTVDERTRSVTGKSAVWVQNATEAQAASTRVRSLVKSKTVSADAAVQVALLNNKGLQAAYAEIGIAGAGLWQETLPPNPSVGIGISGIDPVQVVESAVVQNIMSAITRPRRVAVAETRFRQSQLVAAEATLRLAAETRSAWIEAVAAKERLIYLGQAQASAEASSDLARKLGQTGAFTKTQQAREQVFYAELSGQTAQAKLAARVARENLSRTMGLWGNDLDYALPSALPKLPARAGTRKSIEAEALRNRVDLQIAKLELEALAKSYGLTQATRYVSDVSLLAGVELEREVEEEDGRTETTWKPVPRLDAELTIPIFDTGQARMRQAEMAYMRAANLLAERAVNIRSEARQAFDARQSSYEIARHYRNSVVPLRKAVAEQATLTYNGMITNTFELLADNRAKSEALLMSVNAKRDFWLADAAMKTAIYGGAGGSVAVAGGEAAAPAASSGGGH